MILAVLAVLIYQILAILGVDGISQIVTYIAYCKRDLDTKLMYLQSPLDLILNYNNFRKSASQKATIMAFSTLTLTLGFIPTILTKLNKSGCIYYDVTEAPLQQSDTINTNWPSSMSVLNTFVPYFQYPNGSAIDDMLINYLEKNLQQNISSNPTGVWFGAKHKSAYNYNDLQYGSLLGFYNYYSDYNSSVSPFPYNMTTYNAFGNSPSDITYPSSSSLKLCPGIFEQTGAHSNFITSFPRVHNHTVEAFLISLGVRQVPLYGSDFRTILISSLEDSKSDSCSGKFQPKKIELAMTSGCESNGLSKVARLKVDGTLIMKSSKGSEESSLINEKAMPEYLPK